MEIKAKLLTVHFLLKRFFSPKIFTPKDLQGSKDPCRDASRSSLHGEGLPQKRFVTGRTPCQIQLKTQRCGVVAGGSGALWSAGRLPGNFYSATAAPRGSLEEGFWFCFLNTSLIWILQELLEGRKQDSLETQAHRMTLGLHTHETVSAFMTGRV